jgi:hypothetical protein
MIMNAEWEILSWPILRYYPDIHMDKLRKSKITMPKVAPGTLQIQDKKSIMTIPTC